MKIIFRLTVFFIITLVVTPSVSALNFASEQSKSVKKDEGFVTRVGKWIDGTSEKCECTACPVINDGVVCPGTPVKDIRRPAFEIEFRLDALSAPTGGPVQFGIDDFTFTFKHNFSSVFNVYGSYSSATIEKTPYENSLYDTTWHYQTGIVGFGWYVHPIFELFVGVGKVVPSNSEGSEELGLALEKGVRAHWAINQLGYKVTLAFINRDVPLADEGVDIARSPAVATINLISIGIAIPVGY